MVLAGTGSFVHGKTRDGRRLHFGALGPVLGDYGSGYEVGLAGMRAAFSSPWTARRQTSLAEAVPAGLGLDDMHRVFHTVYMEGLERTRIASLARVVNEQAEAGDRISVKILRDRADDLFELVRDLLYELDLEHEEFPLVAAGSVAVRSRIWWERMCERVAEIAPGARPVRPKLMMATGAALEALQRMGIAWTPGLLDNLETTEREHLARLEAAASSRVSAGAEAAPTPSAPPVSLDGKWSVGV